MYNLCKVFKTLTLFAINFLALNLGHIEEIPCR